MGKKVATFSQNSNLTEAQRPSGRKRRGEHLTMNQASEIVYGDHNEQSLITLGTSVSLHLRDPLVKCHAM
jgi:hypothetical protein